MSYLFYSPKFRPLSPTGAILPNAYIEFWLTGTTTDAPIYADAELTTELDHPVVALANGEFPAIYLDPTLTYRAALYNEAAVLIWDLDPLAPPRDFVPGTVMLFYGDATARDVAYPPTLWQVLDGTNGTPDATDRLLMFAGGSYIAGDTGGATGDVTTSPAGAHDHNGTVSSESLTEAQLPAHGHDVLNRGAGSGIADGTGLNSTQSLAGVRNVAGGSYLTNNSLGTAYVDDTGDGDPHAHDIDAELDHTHTVSGAIPPFIALWALMRRDV